MSTPLFLPNYDEALSSPDTPWKPPPKSLSPDPKPDNIVKSEDDQADSAMIPPLSASILILFICLCPLRSHLPLSLPLSRPAPHPG